MEKIKHIDFHSAISDEDYASMDYQDFAVLTYSNGVKVKVSVRTAMFEAARYFQENEMVDYKELMAADVIRQYEGMKKKSIRGIAKSIAKHAKRYQKIRTEEGWKGVLFIQGEKENHIKAQMKYSYKYFMDGKKEESTISFNEEFPIFDIVHMLEAYAKEKKIHNAKDLLVENGGICFVADAVQDLFENGILPLLQNRLDSIDFTDKPQEIDHNDQDNHSDKLNIQKIDLCLIDGIKVGIVYYTSGDVRYLTDTVLDREIVKCLKEHGIKSTNELAQKGLIEWIEESKFISAFQDNFDKKYESKKAKEPLDVGKIVFYAYADENNELQERAVLFYTNGESKDVSLEEATKEGLKYAHNRKIGDLEKLFDNGIIECVEESKLMNCYEDYCQQARKNKVKKSKKLEKSKKKKNIFKKISEVLRKNKLVRRLTIVTGALVAAIFVGKGAYKLVHHSVVGEKETTESNAKGMFNEMTENSYDQSNVREDFSVYSYDELLQKCKGNNSRKEAMESVYQFMVDYNINSSCLYTEDNSSQKLAHTVDEVAAMYLLYNDIDSDKVNEIFRTTEFNAQQLKNDFANAQRQDSFAHNIQTRTLNKSYLLVKEETKQLYDKYEKLFMEMNDSSFDHKKVECIGKFYEMVRADFGGMATNDYSNLDSSKIIIKEFVDAMANVKVDIDNRLTEEEMNYINGYVEKIVDRKAQDIATRQTARNYEATISYGNGQEVVDVNPYYSDFKDSLIEELQNRNAYCINDADRNISNYDRYKRNTQVDSSVKETTEEKSETTMASTKSTVSNSAARSTIPSPEPAVVGNTQPEPVAVENTQPEAPVVENTQPEQVEEAKFEQVIEEVECEKRKEAVLIEEEDMVDRIPHDEIEMEFPEKIPDRPDVDNFIDFPEAPSEEEIVIPDESPKPDVLPEENTGIDEFIPDEIPPVEEDELEQVLPSGIDDFTIEFVTKGEENIQESEEVTFDEGVIQLDEEKVDENGNLSEEYTDLSTSEVPVESMMSNEEKVDYIISQMEQETAEYIEEYQLVK